MGAVIIITLASVIHLIAFNEMMRKYKVPPKPLLWYTFFVLALALWVVSLKNIIN